MGWMRWLTVLPHTHSHTDFMSKLTLGMNTISLFYLSILNFKFGQIWIKLVRHAARESAVQNALLSLSIHSNGCRPFSISNFHKIQAPFLSSTEYTGPSRFGMKSHAVFVCIRAWSVGAAHNGNFNW